MRTLLLADPHRLVLESLQRVLERRFAVVGAIESGPELLAGALALRPEAIVCDLGLPELDTFHLLRRIRHAGVSARFVALCSHAQISVAAEALRAGAAAYVLKQDSLDVLLAALDAVLRGHLFVTPQLPGDILALLLQAPAAPGNGAPRLSPRQRQVLRLVGEGKTMKQAAAAIGISIRTAETYKYDLMRRLGLRSSAEMVQYAIRLGLVALPPLAALGTENGAG